MRASCEGNASVRAAAPAADRHDATLACALPGAEQFQARFGTEQLLGPARGERRPTSRRGRNCTNTRVDTVDGGRAASELAVGE